MEPSLGRIVLYRSKSGVDMPAIITGLLPKDDDGHRRHVHLHLFAPPGEAADSLNYEWGTPEARNPDAPGPQTWRWPQRTP